jgi:predicted ATPase
MSESRTPTELFGRQRDIGATAELLDLRLVTLTGAGGVGKTELARAVAESERGRFGGVWFCELAGVVEAGALADAVADAIGAVRIDDAPAVTAVASALHGRRALLVLDNVEKVSSAAGRFVAQLLVDNDDLTVLVTSRQALQIDEEQVRSIEPLNADTDAYDLFVAQARRAQPDFDPSGDDDAIRRVCRELDGLPLAIELAAALVSTMTIAEIGAGLEHRVGLLRGEGRNSGHSTLAPTVQWSYDLLDATEQTLFDRLSVFQGGFDLNGAVAVISSTRPTPSAHVDRVVRSVAAKSMVESVDGVAAPRWAMLEPLREFGDQQLAERGERSTVRNAHLEHMMSVASLTGAVCRGGQWNDGVRRFRLERDNLRAAFDWALGTQRSGDVDRILRDVMFMSRWTLEIEPSRWADRAIERSAATGMTLGAPAHLLAAFGHFVVGDHEAALQANLTAIESLGTPSDRAWARHDAAVELLYLDRTADAALMADEMIDEPPSRQVEKAMQLSSHAVFKLLAGRVDADGAMSEIDRAERWAAATGNPVARGHVACNRGMVAVVDQRGGAARDAFAYAMELGRLHGVPNLIGCALTAQVYDPGVRGLTVAADALDYWQGHHDLGNEFVVLEATAINLVEQSRLADGAVVLGHLATDPRRIPSSAVRRAAADAVIGSHRKSRAEFARGATLTRHEVLNHARAATHSALGAMRR